MNAIKYPRTHHVPWSLSKTNDDKTLSSVDHFQGKHVVVTEKMDGENTTMYNNNIHARSIDSANHPSRNWVKQFHASIAHNIPDDMRICGENLFAKHSIHYTNIKSYFYAFSVWENLICLSWEDTQFYLNELGILSVPVLYNGMFDEELIRNIDITGKEGYVIRLADSFLYSDFSKSVAKFVRKNHVQTESHWMFDAITPNVIVSSE